MTELKTAPVETAALETATLPVARPRGAGLWAQLRSRGPELVLIPVVLVTMVALWAWMVSALEIRSVILPGPGAVWDALVRGLSAGVDDPAGFYYHALVTLGEVLGGFALGSVLGLLLALALAQFRLLERVFKPLIVAFQSVPKIAVAPLFIIWFGFGSSSKIALVTLIVFFPVMVAGLTGFQSVDRERLEVMRSLGATRWQTFTKLVLPNSLPYVFAGLEIALVHAMTATIVAEFLAGRAGLGVLIVSMQQVLDTAGIFAVLVVLGVIGTSLVLLLSAIRRRLVFWAGATRGSDG